MEKYNFQKLTPKSDVKLKIYENALDFVFENDDIKNVAITGAYSAGKSSILETYKKQKLNTKFLHISLANFDSSMTNGNIKVETKESILEGKILNQLIHQIDSDKIPQTHFKIKQEVKNNRVLKTGALILVFILLTLYITMFSIWETYVNSISGNLSRWVNNILSISTYPQARLYSSIALIVIFGFMLFTAIKMQLNKNLLKRVSVQGNEIEIFEESKESYFDKYLNEVLYLFENCDADVIVFEDIDRYEMNEIFQRLREVNTLTNNYLKKENKSALRFFYLLRDDTFTSKDRTKFFDYIVPIVPVIDSSNSYDQFIEYFKEGDFYKFLKEDFLQDVSLYVDDMRILKNIYNEFIIYNNLINTTEQDYNKLLALIIYKNIFPRDFSDLQLNQGFVYTLFSKKDLFILNEINSLNKQIDSINEKIETANKEHLLNNEEVDKLYKDELRSYNHNIVNRAQNEVQERKEAIANRLSENNETLYQKIDDLEKQKLVLSNKQLNQIITRSNIKSIFETTYVNEIGVVNTFDEIKESPYFDLIKYLIRNGYIDETYSDYMTYFYENSLSKIDKIFLRSISDKKAKDYNYELKNPQIVVTKLSLNSFDEEEILNFDLLAHLLSTQPNKKQLNRFFNQLRSTENYRFIKSFLDTGKEQSQFVKSLNIQWKNFFSLMLHKGDFTLEQIKNFSILTLYYSSTECIQAINIDNCLAKYISDESNYLDIQNPKVESLINGFKLIEVSFSSINYEIASKDLFAKVYENSLYNLTFEHIGIMLKVFYKLEETEDFSHKNYSLICSSSKSPLFQYVNEKINEYMVLILHNCEGEITDDEEIALSLLNNDAVSIGNKKAYIKVLKTQIEVLDSIKDKNLWKESLKDSLITYSEKNILEYFYNSGNGLDSTLANFINSQEYVLNFHNSINAYGEDASSKLFRAVIKCEELENNKYSDAIKSLRRYYDNFEVPGISKDKIKILIDLNVIRMTKESLIFMREHYPSNTLYYIEKNITSYTDEIIDDEIFDFDEMLNILSLNISDENKISVLRYTNKEISIIDTNYSDKLKKYIVNNNLDSNDIQKLIVSYPQESRLLKTEIKSLAIDNKDEIFAQKYSLSLQLFERLLSSENLEHDDKVEFFVIILPSISKTQAISYLNSLGLKDFVKLVGGGRPKFEINDVNERILTIFQEKGWITKFDRDKNAPCFYRANGRKSK